MFNSHILSNFVYNFFLPRGLWVQNSDIQMTAISGTEVDNPSRDQKSSSSQEQSLLFLFDLETTGLDVYTESITEIAGKVFNPPVTVSNTSFTSLVYTKTYIPEIGNK